MNVHGAVILGGPRMGATQEVRVAPTPAPPAASGQSDRDVVLRHLQHMESRAMSALTVKARRCVLGRLADHLGDVPATATTRQLEDYLVVRRAGGGHPVASNTVRNELSHLRSFYRWLRRHGYRPDDPTELLDMPRLVKAGVPPADDEVIAAAMLAATVDDRAILALSAFAGLRAAEIAALEWADVDLPHSRIVVRRGKGLKPRTVGASAPVREALEALPHRHRVVIRRADGQPGPNAPYQISKRATRLLGGRGGGVTLHQLRHRFATAAYAGTRDLRAVQEALGHSSPITTALYAHTRADDLLAAADAASTLTGA